MEKSSSTPVFVSDAASLQKLKAQPGYELLVQPESNQGELLMSIDEQDIAKTREYVTRVYPHRSFCLLNEQALVDQARWFTEHFLPGDPRAVIAYATKANPRGRILQLLQAGGITHADCSNPTEINQVQRHAPQIQALYAYPYKTPPEIQEALQAGVRYFIIQSISEAKKILDQAKAMQIEEEEIQLALRIKHLNPKAHINLSQKFGIDTLQAYTILKNLKSFTRAMLGIAVNTGSQNADPQSYIRAVRILSDLARDIGGVQSINLGGGFPVNYYDHEDYALESYMQQLQEAIQDKISEILIGDDPMIIIEPGRALVAEAIELVIYVRGREDGPNGPALIIDDGLFTSFISVLGNDLKPKMSLLNSKKETHLEEFNIFGRTCDSGDKFPSKIKVPSNVSEGNYLMCNLPENSTETKFNGFLPPEYIAYNLHHET